MQCVQSPFRGARCTPPQDGSLEQNGTEPCTTSPAGDLIGSSSRSHHYRGRVRRGSWIGQALDDRDAASDDSERSQAPAAVRRVRARRASASARGSKPDSSGDRAAGSRQRSQPGTNSGGAVQNFRSADIDRAWPLLHAAAISEGGGGDGAAGRSAERLGLAGGQPRRRQGRVRLPHGRGPSPSPCRRRSRSWRASRNRPRTGSTINPPGRARADGGGQPSRRRRSGQSRKHRERQERPETFTIHEGAKTPPIS